MEILLHILLSSPKIVIRENDLNYEQGCEPAPRPEDWCGDCGLSDSLPLLFNDPQSSGTTSDANIVYYRLVCYISWP
jgi:hypothetical protein